MKETTMTGVGSSKKADRERYLNQLIKEITKIYWGDYPDKHIVYNGNKSGDRVIFVTNNSNRYEIIDLEEEPTIE